MGGKKDKDSIRLWFGQAWKQDEACEMLETLSTLEHFGVSWGQGSLCSSQPVCVHFEHVDLAWKAKEGNKNFCHL